MDVNKRKVGKIYANKDENGKILTYSILHRMSEGEILKFERNSRSALRALLQK
jgi:hypothetical protein